MVGFFGCDFWMPAASEQNPVVHGVAVEGAVAVSRMAVFVKGDFEFAAVGQFHALAQAAGTAKTVEHPRHGARVLAQVGGLALEAVNFLDDFDGNQDVVVHEAQKRVGIVKEDVGVENVIFH